MKTPMSPITGKSEEPPGTGWLFATSPSEAPGAKDTGDLFADEMDDALARQGGVRSVESRQEDLRARRSLRRESFEGAPDEPVERGEDPEVLDELGDGAAAGAWRVERSVTSTEAPTVSSEGHGQASGGLASSIQEAGTRGSAPSTDPPPGTPAPQLEMAQLARLASGAGAKVSHLQPVHATGEARIEATTQAFLDAARGTSSKGSPRSAAAGASAMSDPELVEKANEIMRQIRLSIAPGATQVTLDLDPAELGRLWIRMSFRGGKLAARIRAEKQETLDALTPRMEELRELFADRGIEADTLELELGFREESSDRRPGSFPGQKAHPVPNKEHPVREIDERMDASNALRRPPSSADGIDTYA